MKITTKKKSRSNQSESVSSTKKDDHQKASESTLSKPNSVPTPPVTNDTLWDRAEKKLKGEKDKQELLQKATKILEEWGLDPQLSGRNGCNNLCDFLENQKYELTEKQWVIFDHKVSVQNRVTKVMRNILMVKDVINTAASTSPPAAIACAAVTVSLLVSPLCQVLARTDAKTIPLSSLSKVSNNRISCCRV